MGMDLRRPIGILFLVYGVILLVYGLVRPQPVLDLNVNAIWGAVLAVFGAAMLTLAWRGRDGQDPAPRPEQRASAHEVTPRPPDDAARLAAWLKARPVLDEAEIETQGIEVFARADKGHVRRLGKMVGVERAEVLAPMGGFLRDHAIVGPFDRG